MPMRSSQPAPPYPSPWSLLLQLLRQQRRRWLVPLVVCVAGAICLAVFQRPTWSTRGTVIVLEEAGLVVPSSDYARQRAAVQRMVADQLSSRPVVDAAWQDLLPEASSSVIATLAGVTVPHLSIRPPAHAEWGRTDVLRVELTTGNRAHGVPLLERLVSNADEQLKNVRVQQATNLIANLTAQLTAQGESRKQAAAQIRQLEQQAAKDLPELRSWMHSDNHDSLIDAASTTQRRLIARNSMLQQQQQLQMQLKKVVEQGSAEAFLSLPSALLDLQPSLRKLHREVLDAQTLAAELMNRMSPRHPQVQAARQQERQLRQRLPALLLSESHKLNNDIDWSRRELEQAESEQGARLHRLHLVRQLQAEYAEALEALRHWKREETETESRRVAAMAELNAAEEQSLLRFAQEPTTVAAVPALNRWQLLLAGLMLGIAAGMLNLVLGSPPGELWKQPEFGSQDHAGSYLKRILPSRN